VSGLFAAETAVLLKIQFVRRVSLILGRRIVFALALAASKQYDFPHFRFLPLKYGEL
jgi:hypothetical protein